MPSRAAVRTVVDPPFSRSQDKVLNRIRSMRDGKLYEYAFGKRMRGEGIFADQIESLFDVACRKHGLDGDLPKLSTAFIPAGTKTSPSWPFKQAEK